jgi:hypothetical protein
MLYRNKFGSPVSNSSWRDEVKGVLYRDYHVIGVAHLLGKTGYWVPTVRVRWRDAGTDQQFELTGPQNRFRTKEDAEDYAVSMGKDWIDKKNPIP